MPQSADHALVQPNSGYQWDDSLNLLAAWSVYVNSDRVCHPERRMALAWQ